MKKIETVAGIVIGLLIVAMWACLFAFSSARDSEGIERGEYEKDDIPQETTVLYDYEPENVPYIYVDYCEEEFKKGGECILPEEEDLTP